MKISLLGNQEGVYTDPVSVSSCMDYTKADNYANVDLNGVNHLVIRRNLDKTFRIIQAGGYTPDRGLFVDMY